MVQQEPGFQAGEQQLTPQPLQPAVIVQNLGGSPDAVTLALQFVCVTTAEGSRRACVCSNDEAAIREQRARLGRKLHRFYSV